MKLSDEFEKNFNILSRYYSAQSVFYDLMKMSAISIYNAFAKDEKLEQDYLKIINSYKKEHQELFPKLFAQIINSCQRVAREGYIKDILGEYYCVNKFSNSRMGQFFTPNHISGLMAKILLNDSDKNAKEIIKENGFITLSEPTCGAGRNDYIFCTGIKRHWY